jgi:hypothetical protein
MFHPLHHPLQRGWVGRVDGDRVVHLAAQTLQSFFGGGGGAREHAVYPLDGVVLLAPVLHPPTVRVFESAGSFAFANASAVVGPAAVVPPRPSLRLLPRLAAVVGGDGEPAGFTGLAELRAPDRPPPKDRDFALVTGPVVVTADELDPDAVDAAVDGGERLSAPPFDWAAALALAREGTELRLGDLLAGPAFCDVPVGPGRHELRLDPVGELAFTVAAGARR